ncbi:MAG: serine/threonine protein kinase [Chloroflexi bacterium]|nr:MAG: serine/threonine protein kinase [Chloroflexota bacterium]
MAWQAGENVGPYRIIGQLGQGGMATVYKAYHPQLDRYVAIKVMHEAFQEDDAFIARFEREAKIVARLEHPHIVPVYGYDRYEGQPYLVMKYIEGKTLKHFLKNGPLPLEEILRIMTAVADALNYAHKQGVLHRDIKPSNIMIADDGTPYLTDFGLARIAQAGESTLSQDMLLGTPHYISPEQARGEQNLDGRTDIYSFGIVLYELVVGRVPFSADTPYAIIHDHIYTPLPLPTRVNPNIPEAVETVLLKALAKSPKDRFESANALMQAFKKAVETSNLTELDIDRVRAAEISLAKLREETNKEIEAGYRTPTPSPIPAAYATPIPMQTQLEYLPYKHGRKWLLGGVVLFLTLCVLSMVVVVGALENFNRLEELDAARQPPITDGPAAEPPIDEPPSDVDFSYDNIPQLSVQEARALVNDYPDEPVPYLALANAYWERGGDAAKNAARAALREGGILAAGEEILFAGTAARLADENGQVADALAYYTITHTIAKEQDKLSAEIEDETLAYAYDHADDIESMEVIGGIISAVIGTDEVIDGREISNSPVLRVAAVRAAIMRGRNLSAERTLRRIMADEALDEAVIQLLNGELALHTDNAEEGLTILNQLTEDESAPEWVRVRATELIESTGE